MDTNTIFLGFCIGCGFVGQSSLRSVCHQTEAITVLTDACNTSNIASALQIQAQRLQENNTTWRILLTACDLL